MVFVEIDPGLRTEISSDLLQQAAAATLSCQSVGEADLTLVLTGDARIKALNRKFLHRDAPTDVLSLPAGEADPETGRRYLGDVVVSLPRARSQARAAGHALEQEVQLLVVHGILHLLNYDHAEAGEKTRMWAAQAEVLERLGVPASIVHE